MHGKMFAAILSACAFTGLMLASTPAAQASVVPYHFTNHAGYGDLWYAAGHALFYTSNDHSTALTGDLSANGEWKLPAGECMTFYYSGPKGSDLVDEHSCQNLASQHWFLQAESNGTFILENVYAYSVYENSCGATQLLVLGGTGHGGVVGIGCTNDNGVPRSSQEWTVTSV